MSCTIPQTATCKYELKNQIKKKNKYSTVGKVRRNHMRGLFFELNLYADFEKRPSNHQQFALKIYPGLTQAHSKKNIFNSSKPASFDRHKPLLTSNFFLGNFSCFIQFSIHIPNRLLKAFLKKSSWKLYNLSTYTLCQV